MKTAKFTIEIGSDIAAVLSHAARGIDPDDAQSLPEFLTEAANRLAGMIATYWSEFEATMKAVSDVPDDVEQAIVDLSRLGALGMSIAHFTGPEYTRFDEVEERMQKLDTLLTLESGPKILLPGDF